MVSDITVFPVEFAFFYIYEPESFSVVVSLAFVMRTNLMVVDRLLEIMHPGYLKDSISIGSVYSVHIRSLISNLMVVV